MMRRVRSYNGTKERYEMPQRGEDAGITVNILSRASCVNETKKSTGDNGQSPAPNNMFNDKPVL